MNVEAGDLAIVVNVKSFPENNGMIVKVVRRVLCDCGCSRNGWECRSEGRPFVGVVVGLGVMRGMGAFVDDVNLRPISGLPLDEDIDQVEEIAA